MNSVRAHHSIIFKALILLLVSMVVLGCGAGEMATSTVAPVSADSHAPVATEPTAAEGSPVGGGSQIAFMSNRDGNSEIYVMKSDGTSVTRLTTSPDVGDFFPKFSPDGQILLYWSYSKDPSVSNLQWLKADGSTGIFAEDVQPYTSFSPDGLTVALCVATGNGNVDIFTGSVQGGSFTKLTDTPKWDYEPAWSPDGTTIAFVSQRDGTPHIYLMDADGKNQRRLSTSDMDQLEPAWSPDGNEIAFLSEQGDNHSNIYLMDLDGTNIRNLTNQATGLNENPAWSPDGTMIAFWSDRTGNHDIFSMMLDGTGLVNLTDNPADDENPTWSK